MQIIFIACFIAVVKVKQRATAIGGSPVMTGAADDCRAAEAKDTTLCDLRHGASVHILVGLKARVVDDDGSLTRRRGSAMRARPQAPCVDMQEASDSGGGWGRKGAVTLTT